jgi:hypothetical protein
VHGVDLGAAALPVTPSGGTTTLRVLFSGSVIPFSGPSEFLLRPSAGTGAYSTFVIGDSVPATTFNFGATQPGFIMGRTVDMITSTVAFDYLVTETTGSGAVAFGQGSLVDGSANLLLRSNGSTFYTGTSTSFTIAFWNTTKVTGRFTVLQLM